MLDGTYTIQIDTPMGKKHGKVILRTEGDKAYARIDAPVIGKQETELKADGDTFESEGTFKVFLVGKVTYRLSGEVKGDDLYISLKTSKGDFEITGKRS